MIPVLYLYSRHSSDPHLYVSSQSDSILVPANTVLLNATGQYRRLFNLDKRRTLGENYPSFFP